jgi:hypothetical protein
MSKWLAIFFLASSIARADDRLIGRWRSNHDETMRFAKEHSIWTERQTHFLNQLFGHLELSFDGKTMRNRFPDITVETNGQTSAFKGFENAFLYRELGSDEDSVAILIKNYFGHDSIVQYHFVNRDRFWVYADDPKMGLADLNFREYFDRVTTPAALPQK